MILSIADQNVAVRHDCDALETLEFCVARAPGTKSSQKASIWMEDLDSVVPGIGHANIPKFVDSDAPWELELSFLRAFASEARQNFSVDIEDLNTMVVRVGHDHAVCV